MGFEISIKQGTEITAQEIYGIVQLRNAVFIVELQRALQDIDGQDLLPSVYQLMAKNEAGEIVGHLRLHLHDDYAHIRRVVVAKEYRGYGLSREMMEEAISWCKKRGLAKIVLAARAHLLDFYGSLNFVPTSEKYFHEETAVWHQNLELIL